MKKLYEKLWFWFLIFLLLIVIVCFFPYWFTSRSFFNLDFNKTGPIGDTIGGIMGPFIAIVAAFLTFIAFWVQYKFNKEQILRFDKQETDLKVERFENRFFELLKLHRDNVQEFEIVRYHTKHLSENEDTKLTGRRIFVSMVDELRLSYRTVELANKTLIGQDKVQEDYYSKKDLFKVAYLLFFDGIATDKFIRTNNPSDSLRYKVLGKKYDLLLLELFPLVEKIQTCFIRREEEYKTYIKCKDEIVPGAPAQSLERIAIPKIKYYPFGGHNSRLGHYFRHLYQMVKYVIKQDERVINNKYEYIKIVRAQLSNYEQVLLYYNSISVFGKAWLDEKYLTEWRMIKNLPLYVANFGPLPKDLLGEFNSKGERLFEVDEVSNEVAE